MSWVKNKKTAFLFLALGVLFFGLISTSVFAEGETSSSTPPEETILDEITTAQTGDAVSGSDTQNIANTNITTATSTGLGNDYPDDLYGPPQEDQNFGIYGTSTSEEEAALQGLLFVDEATSTPDVLNNNNASVENNATTTAETGENEVAGQNVVIDTGNALAYANVVNVVNTNILNSNGFLAFFSQLFGLSDVDLRDLFSFFDAGEEIQTASSCSLLFCDEENTSLEVVNNNTGMITNNIIVRSSTGENYASSTGDALIETGDAYAFSNILNVVNTNITDSNYLIVSFNNIGDLAGDIVLPDSNFFNGLLSQFALNGGQSRSGALVENNNDVDIENNVSTVAETGNNTASSTLGTSSITTGDADSSSAVTNQANTNIFGSDSILMIFRIHGDWAGEIFGLPEGLLWSETPNGIELYSTPINNTSGNEGLTVESVTNNNTATIQNNVDVYALTGDNRIEAQGNAEIVTGNAEADSSIVNIANTNVLGKNWIVLIFNIFGDWFGNLSFGLPDLWIGGVASASGSTVGEGEQVAYKFTVMNNGDAIAKNVVLKGTFDGRFIKFSSYDRAYEDENGSNVFWDIGSVGAGEVKELAYSAQISGDLPSGEIPITVTASLDSGVKDGNTEDNTEEVTLIAVNNSGGGGGGGSRVARVSSSATPSLVLVKTADTSKLYTASSSVNFKLTLTNKGGNAYNGTLRDVLVDSNNKPINEQSWDLGKILPNEQITVSYDMVFGSTTPAGVYSNTAQVHAFDSTIETKRKDILSNVATSTVSIGGAVLGAATCDPYILEYMRQGAQNNPDEVKKLQSFLKENISPTLPITGYFGPLTRGAVMQFQEKYREEILGPWKIAATGNVYLTTRKKINEIYCGGSVVFPLSPEELNTISSGGAASLSSVLSTVKPNTALKIPTAGIAKLSQDVPETAVQDGPVLANISKVEDNGFIGRLGSLLGNILNF